MPDGTRRVLQTQYLTPTAGRIKLQIRSCAGKEAIGAAEPPSARGAGRHGVQRQAQFFRGRQMSGVCRNERHLEEVTTAERVETVLNAVLAKGHVDPGRHKLPHPCRAASDQPSVSSALDNQIRSRIGNDGDTRSRASGNDLPGVRIVGSCERTGVTSGDTPLPSAPLGFLGDHRQGADISVVGLVDVQVEVSVEALCKVETEPYVFTLLALGPFPVRHAAHDVGPSLHGSDHEFARPGIAQDPLLREGDDLNLSDVGAVPGGRHDALERHQATDGVDVYMRPQPGRTGQYRALDNLARPAPHILTGVGALGGVNCLDRSPQRPIVLRELVTGERFVEMDVRVNIRGDEQATGCVYAILKCGPGTWCHSDHAVAVDDDVARLSIGESCTDDRTHHDCHLSDLVALAFRLANSSNVTLICAPRALPLWPCHTGRPVYTGPLALQTISNRRMECVERVPARRHYRVANSSLFEWLTGLYPLWAGIDAEASYRAAWVGLAELALGGCTTTTDHLYIHPRYGGDLWSAEIDAAREVGLHVHPARGSMSRSVNDGGLPCASVIQDEDEILADCERLVAAHHDPSWGAMVRIALAPCSLFTASARLMRRRAELAEKLDVRLHTHLAEDPAEDASCRAIYGRRPVEHFEDSGWLTDRAWVAHCIYPDQPDLTRMGGAGVGVAHCPSSNMLIGGGGFAPVGELRAAGATVGLGCDGSASTDSASLWLGARTALLLGRQRNHGHERPRGSRHGDPPCRRLPGPRERRAPRAMRRRGRRPGLLATGWSHPRWRAHRSCRGVATVCGPSVAPHTVVAGRSVVEDGVLTVSEVDEMLRRHQATAARLQGIRGF